MERLLRLADVMGRIAVIAGRIGSWAAVPLMGIIIVDVISRRFLSMGSTLLQELQWHLHGLLFLLCLGYAYVRNAHVRVELVREHMSERAKLMLEVLGFVLILAPFCAILIWYGIDISWRSWDQGEGSAQPGGLPHRWIIKLVVPIGLLLVMFAGAAVAIRNFLLLYAGPELRKAVAAREFADTQGAIDERRN